MKKEIEEVPLETLINRVHSLIAYFDLKVTNKRLKQMNHREIAEDIIYDLLGGIDDYKNKTTTR